jgi:tetratricopeptide (TPR) repeat protein
MTTKNVFKVIVIMLIIFLIVIGISYTSKKKYGKEYKSILVTGLKSNQAGIVNEISKASEEYNYIENGNKYLKENRIKEAIEQYNIGISKARTSSMRDLARIRLVDAYEKARDYETASKLLGDMIEGYKVPKGHLFRIPDEERFEYLKYASKGEHSLAVEHAQKALEADTKLPNRPKEGSPDYIERLNDLKAAKDYILSLKKQ